jgi:WD40 repeat protein
MVYDTAARRALWRSEPGHTETIFFCSWAPHDPNLLATCSYDGTVRIWDVSSCRCKHVLISSAPCGRTSDDASSGKGEAF